MPNQRKADYQQTRNDIRSVRDRTAVLRPQYTANRMGIAAFQNQRNNDNPEMTAIREGWKGVMSNPMRPTVDYKLGFSPDTVSKMKAGAADIVSAGRTRATRDINRNIAAQGMGNTGAGIRAVMELEPEWTGRSIAAQRDVDIDAANAEREDYWKKQAFDQDDYWAGRDLETRGLQGLDTFERGREAFNLDAFDMQRRALNDEAQLESIDLASFNPEMAAQEGMYRPGFWGKLGSSFANSLGQTLGGGFAAGLGNIGSGMAANSGYTTVNGVQYPNWTGINRRG